MTAVACGEPEARNLVQWDALEKSFFVGDLGDPSDDPVFVVTAEIVDDECDGCMPIELGTVKWEILSGYLMGRESPSRVIVSYPIETHFNIRFDERQHAIVESEDGWWNEREYMRVDWTVQLVGSYDFLPEYLGAPQCDFAYQPSPFVSNADAPRFEVEAGEFTITNIVSAELEEVTELCAARSATEVKIRFTFRRIA